MPYYDCEETDRAVDLYFRRVRRIEGDLFGATQPNRHDTRREGDTIIIASGDYVLARYRVKPDGSLRRLVAKARC